MKKFIAIAIVTALGVSGCASNSAPTAKVSDAPATQAATATTEAKPTEEAPKKEEPKAGATGFKSGLGEVVKISSSKNVSEKDGKPVDGVGQVDNIMASVSVDADGKIISVTIDNAQTKVNFDAKGKLTSDLTSEQKTKSELGDAYGMKKASSLGKEWYEEIAVLETWMLGKTIDEVKAMKSTVKDETHPMVPDEPDLKSSVTLSVEGYVAAVEEAIKNAKVVEVAPAKTGLGQIISITGSKDVSEKDGKDVDGSALVETTMASVALDESGKILAVTIDMAKTTINFDKTGKVTSDLKAEQKTKVEIGDAYGMKKASSISKEWYEQIAALETWMVGKTIDEVKAIKVTEKDAENKMVPSEADLVSSVTLSVDTYIAAVAEAVANAR